MKLLLFILYITTSTIMAYKLTKNYFKDMDDVDMLALAAETGGTPLLLFCMAFMSWPFIIAENLSKNGTIYFH